MMYRRNFSLREGKGAQIEPPAVVPMVSVCITYMAVYVGKEASGNQSAQYLCRSFVTTELLSARTMGVLGVDG